MKYFDNNQYNSIRVKALDSMPVGTQVEFNGSASNIPTGWEAVGNDYSTTEINTGKTWIDGKPIYRKVITYSKTANNTNWTNITFASIGLSNVSYIYFANGSRQYQGNRYVKLANSDYNLYIDMSKSTIDFAPTGNYTMYFTLVLEYTKTTD